MSNDESTRRWTLDPARSVVEFRVGAFWGLGTVEGRVERFDGWYEVGPDGAHLELALDAASIETGNAMIDERVRDAVRGQSQVRFSSTRIDEQDGVLRIAGVADAVGRTQQVTALATIARRGTDVDIESTTIVDDFGRGVPAGPLTMLRPPGMLHVKVRFAAAGSAAAARNVA
ncbi:MAG TPA: YceI family protein [Gaiellaceae bacterium]|nr:YceI family protein [Gaiellaceae bacterium]